MKRIALYTAVITAGLVGYQFIATAAEPTTVPAAASASTQPAGAFGTPHQTASYGIGYDLGKNMKETRVAFDTDLLVQGIKDAMAGTESKVPTAQFQAAMMQVQQEIMANMQAKQAEEGAKAGQEGTTFREENGKKAGVTTTKSGLQIETIKEGTGAMPKATDTVKVHYTGTLTNGTKFDSSVDRGEPISFPLNGVIPGWTEGLQLMKVGGKSRLVIPSEIAYGPEGRPPTIPPNATLVFEVELLDIVPPGTAK